MITGSVFPSLLSGGSAFDSTRKGAQKLGLTLAKSNLEVAISISGCVTLSRTHFPVKTSQNSNGTRSVMCIEFLKLANPQLLLVVQIASEKEYGKKNDCKV
ncbi:unnamed protein product [Arabidopsis thaliana]|uniref:Uncharacterized protein n=2 Tax=Arabidopsis thaliana TaxID=3702 RepID=A0A654F1T3_ARATH|nr:uncharacterized protein AT2G40165 [Arabidopsis thaliana]ANM61458.1 hypothetical protein AT2G40165 [Arabidopsis thaliana]CAA0375857.1 unnamed protein product [Arabidopsis thaliana]VYS55038.1 unnamed protein product [Arabidopsis thaliana]|eukprot:NP_001323675.1 hypothetical protein AT2G40165 [Arabidopsis thaliana]